MENDKKKNRKNKQKDYSKESRRRTKQYIKELEAKVECLEEEVQRINYELWKIKNDALALASGLKPTATEILGIEKEIRKILTSKDPKVLEKVKKSEFKEMVNSVATNSKPRINQIKHHFRAIIDSLLNAPERMLVFISQKPSKISKQEYAQV